jgi:hypothetical protein
MSQRKTHSYIQQTIYANDLVETFNGSRYKVLRVIPPRYTKSGELEYEVEFISGLTILLKHSEVKKVR